MQAFVHREVRISSTRTPTSGSEISRNDHTSAAREAEAGGVVTVVAARLGLVRGDPIDAMETWQSLVSGRRRIVASYCSESNCHLELEPFPGGPRVLSTTDVATLEQILLGTYQKVIALDTKRSASTIAQRAVRAMRSFGLDCKVSALPAALVILVQSTHRQVPVPEMRSSVLANGEREIITVPLPNIHAERTLSAAESQLVAFLLEGRSRREMTELRRSCARTIANQMGSIYRKLSVSGRIPLLTRIIERNGYVPQEDSALVDGLLTATRDAANQKRACV